MPLTKSFMVIETTFDSDVTDADSVSSALDTLMDTARSTPGILGEYGNPAIEAFYPIDPEDIKHLHDVARGPITQQQRDALANILHRLGAIATPSLPAPTQPPNLEAQILEILQDNSESFINIDIVGPDKRVCQNVTDEIMAAIMSSGASLPFSPVMRSVADCIVERGQHSKKQVDQAIHDYDEDHVWEEFIGPMIDKIEEEVVGSR